MPSSLRKLKQRSKRFIFSRADAARRNGYLLCGFTTSPIGISGLNKINLTLLHNRKYQLGNERYQNLRRIFSELQGIVEGAWLSYVTETITQKIGK